MKNQIKKMWIEKRIENERSTTMANMDYTGSSPTIRSKYTKKEKTYLCLKGTKIVEGFDEKGWKASNSYSMDPWRIKKEKNVRGSHSMNREDNVEEEARWLVYSVFFEDHCIGNGLFKKEWEEEFGKQITKILEGVELPKQEEKEEKKPEKEEEAEICSTA